MSLHGMSGGVPLKDAIIIESPFYKTLYRFGLSATSGVIAGAIFYPADVAKTLMQNQRPRPDGTYLHKNEMELLKKIITGSGFGGLYKGLTPFLVSMALVQGVKLTVNDLVKDSLYRGDGKNETALDEIVPAIASAVCQSLVKNPLEVVKIRVQTASMQSAMEGRPMDRYSTIGRFREMGLRECFKGTMASCLRDTQFLCVFFPAYAYLKTVFANDKGYVSNASMFYAAFLAGVPASGLCNPLDVIKTRVQALAKPGTVGYNGVLNTARTIWHEEGFQAFWRGTTGRIIRTSPQFALTMGFYELFQRLFNVVLV